MQSCEIWYIKIKNHLVVTYAVFGQIPSFKHLFNQIFYGNYPFNFNF